MTAEGGKPFEGLTPERMIEAVESLGLRCDGRLLALNSYENRVYRIGLEDAEPVVGKFYRDGRWSDAAIVEEHEFVLELAEAEIPMRNGRAAELEDPAVLRHVGRLVGRLHNVGAASRFAERPTLDPRRMGRQARDDLLEGDWIPSHLLPAYRSVSEHLLDAVESRLASVHGLGQLRLHGDAHPGNLLARETRLLLVDFDDAINGPAIQDLWLFLAGDREEQSAGLVPLLEGYTAFRDFDPRELGLIEALRALRIVHHSAWLARRWDDPAFPIAFPWFDSPRYWDEQVLVLREQLALMQEPPPRWEPA